MGFSASTIIDPTGRAGGIWLIWDTDQVNVRASTVSNQFIQATIHEEDFEEWVLNAVYASPNPLSRETLWENLEDTASHMNKPWLVMGDFNDYAYQNERKSFSHSQNQNRTQRFRERINNCNLIDLGSVGPRFTWTNNRQGMANIMQRLDRALCNDQWQALFPEGTVRTLPRTYSDHSPLVVYTQCMHSPTTHNGPFCFEAAWMCHPSFFDVVHKSWLNMEFKLLEAIDNLTHNIKI